MWQRTIDGCGAEDAEIFFLGEGPGIAEIRAGEPFAGKVGDEIDRYLADLGLSRDDVFMSYLVRFDGGKDYVYTADDFARDEPALLAELQRVRPRIIVPLGKPATRWLLGDVDMDDVQAMPWVLPNESPLVERTRMDWLRNVVVFPITHPGAGFNSPDAANHVVNGFQQLGAFLDGHTEARILFDDAYPEPHYEEIETVERLREVLAESPFYPNTGMTLRMGADSEGIRKKPWSIQFSLAGGTGYLIHANSRHVLAAFMGWLRQNRAHLRVVFHSALHDLIVFREMGLDLIGDEIQFDDTMVMAYLLQIEPQGLKALAARHANMSMRSYQETLGDAQYNLAVEYLTWLYEMEEEDHVQRCADEFTRLTTTPYTDSRGKVHSGRRLKVHPKLPKSALHKAVTRVLGSKDPYRLWNDQVEDIQVAAYRRLGAMPEATLDYVQRPAAVHYGSRDADATVRVEPELRRRLDALGLGEVYKLELGVYPLYDRMQQAGIRPEVGKFRALSERLSVEIAETQRRLIEATGNADFNANSGDQVAAYLFDELQIDGGKKTRSGRFSTNDKVLEALEREHGLKVISDIRSYREYYKLKHTFCDVVPDLIAEDGRVHPEFRTTRIPSGRLAATMPRGFRRFNMLAQPKHGKFANDFRRGWVPDAGHVFTEHDLSQAELRVGAHLSQDPYMLAVYRGEIRAKDGSLIDLHAGLGSRIFGKEKDDQTSGERTAMKAINFGFWMGQTYIGLCAELRKNGVMVSEDDAQRWLDEANALYKGANAYKQRMCDEARQNGFVRCLSGRIRYIGGIRSRDDRVQAEAERYAYSTPIQEGARWIMKQVEARIWHELLVPAWKRGQWVEPILDIHDAVLVEHASEDEAREFHPKIMHLMENTVQGFSVPIIAEGELGWNWAKQVKEKKVVVDNFEGMRGL